MGCPYHSAVVEAFWGRVQVELLNRQTWKTRIELASAIHDYIELFHNTRLAPLGVRHAHPERIRETLLPDPRCRLTPEPRLHGTRDRSRCPRNRGNSNSRPVRSDFSPRG
ncbi:MAG: IS3 family transposase [Thermoleophilia bacterium]